MSISRSHWSSQRRWRPRSKASPCSTRRYAEEPARTSLDNGEHFAAAAVGVGGPPRTAHGDIDAGFAAATHTTEADYVTPAQYHNAMEPHAVVAQWDGDHLTLDMPNQALVLSCASYAAYFGVPRENVLIRSPFLGGAASGPRRSPTASDAGDHRRPHDEAARQTRAVARADVWAGRASWSTWQSCGSAADAEGQLTALQHSTTSATSSFDNFLEPASNASLPLYASPAIVSGTRWRSP